MDIADSEMKRIQEVLFRFMIEDVPQKSYDDSKNSPRLEEDIAAVSVKIVLRMDFKKMEQVF